MADFEKAIVHVLKWEGGLVEDPDDPGGLTNRGVTIGVFKKYSYLIDKAPTRQNLINLTEDQAEVIYKQVFWLRIKGDLIHNQNIANAMLDGVVNTWLCGIKLMQRQVGVDMDGIVGPKTLEAINMSGNKSTFDGYIDARQMYYENLVKKKPRMEKFLKGWINRIRDLKYGE